MGSGRHTHAPINKSECLLVPPTGASPSPNSLYYSQNGCQLFTVSDRIGVCGRELSKILYPSLVGIYEPSPFLSSFGLWGWVFTGNGRGWRLC